MPPFTYSVIACFLISFFSQYTLYAQESIVIQPGPSEGKDAKVWSLQPNTNFANHEFIKANAWTWGGEFGIERTYIEFDLSVIPQSAVISEAYLSLYYHFLPGNPEQTHYGDNKTTLKRVVTPWDESNITWSNQPGTTEQNKVLMPSAVGPQVDFEDIDVTLLIIDMLNFPENSFGFQLKLQNEDIFRRVGLSTSDHPASNRWPKLEIFFTCNIDLGNDTLLCEGDTLYLNAGSGYTQYLWNTGSIDSLISVTTSGQYWVTVHDGNDCEASDTINVVFYQDILDQLNLGADTTLCFGGELLLEAGDGFESYLWQNGSAYHEFLVQNPGLYWVTVTSLCGSVTDSIFISYYPEINLELGNDTLLCEGKGILLDAGYGFMNYHWNDGSSFYQNYITNQGLYTVEVWDINNCYASDEIHVSYHYLNLDLGNDTLICPGNSIEIMAGDSFEYYAWNDSTLIGQSFFNIQNPGTYWVEVTDSFQNIGCHASDTIVIGQYLVPSYPALEDEYSICQGETLVLNAGVGNEFNYLWETGSNDSLLIVNSQGELKVWIYNTCDTIEKNIDIYMNPVPEVNILLDSANSTDSYFRLILDDIFDSILWSTGSEDINILVTNTGLYWVQVVNEYGCSSSDTLFIKPIICDFEVPSVFTPNGDDKNPFFRIDNHFINEFEIIIFDRWGKWIYEAHDPYFLWDGTSHGKKCPDGVYYWIIKYNCSGNSGFNFFKKGSGTIL
jgi:gliding motility-associated-like protein